MEISAEKTKLMTNNTLGINTEIKVNGQKFETVTSFKYLASVTTDEDSKPEILSRIAKTTAALTRLKPVWNDRSIFLCCADSLENQVYEIRSSNTISSFKSLLKTSFSAVLLIVCVCVGGGGVTEREKGE